MRKIIWFVFALLYAVTASSQSLQTQLNQAKFEIVKKTVEFLSTDTLFKKVNKNTCENCKTFDDLKKFAQANNVLNAGTIVITPLSDKAIDATAENWKASINNFKQQAIDKVSGGERTRRKDLKGYGAYIASLDEVVENIKPLETKPAQDSGPAVANTGLQEKPALGRSISDQGIEVQKNSLSSILWLWLPYGIAAILLGLLGYVASKNSKIEKGKSYYKDKVERLNSQINDHKQTILKLEGENNNLKKQLHDSEIDREYLTDRLQVLEKNTNQLQADTNVEMLVPMEKSNKKPAFKQAVQQPANLKYARYADMGDGFSNSELLEHPDNETIFELTMLTGNTAEYKISGNPDAQRYALSNAEYFLGKTCKYDLFPSDNTSIQTITSGILKLNAGKWTITNPAKISFS